MQDTAGNARASTLSYARLKPGTRVRAERNYLLVKYHLEMFYIRSCKWCSLSAFLLNLGRAGHQEMRRRRSHSSFSLANSLSEEGADKVRFGGEKKRAGERLPHFAVRLEHN